MIKLTREIALITAVSDLSIFFDIVNGTTWESDKINSLSDGEKSPSGPTIAHKGLLAFLEISNFHEEICGVGDKGKIETFVPSDASGKNSSELSIGLRGKKEIYSETCLLYTSPSPRD